MAQDKKIEDYLNLYLGCELVSIATGDVVGKLDGVVNKNAHFRVNGINYEAPASGYKPILRPLSDMSEEEKIELAKMHDSKIEWQIIDGKPTGRENIGIKQIMEFEGDMFLIREIENNLFGSEREGNISASNISNFELTRYLLSKHFDLFGLIEAGLAIDKTPLK